MFFFLIWIVVVLLVLVMTFDASKWIVKDLARNFQRNMNLAKLVFNMFKLWGNRHFVQEADPRHLEISRDTLSNLRRYEQERERDHFSRLDATDRPLLLCLSRLSATTERFAFDYHDWSSCVTTLTR